MTSTHGKRSGGDPQKPEKKWIRLAAAAFWLLVWQLVSQRTDLRLFTASPPETLRQIINLFFLPSFWKIIACSTGRILTGFLPAVFLGSLLAVLSARNENFAAFVILPMRLIRTIPVVSFIILALLLVSSRFLSQTIAFTMALPTVYLNVLQGIRECSRDLEEMAELFRLDAGRKLRYVILPQVFPYFRSGTILALGFAWKSGVAAEVIGMPAGSIGERLQQAKVYLDTSNLFAWTAVIVVLGILSEKILDFLLDRGYSLSQRMKEPHKKAVRTASGKKQPEEASDGTGNRMTGRPGEIRITDLVKSYDGRMIWEKLSAVFPPGSVTAVTGPSGIGKTTLLRVLSGLEQPDDGRIEGIDRSEICFVFQEDRLVEHLNAAANIRLVNRELADSEVQNALQALGLSAEDAMRPVCEFSGGMKRRTALARAVLSYGSILIMDEPFRGLDEESRQKAVHFLQKNKAGRTVIFAVHQKEEAYGAAQILELGS